MDKLFNISEAANIAIHSIALIAGSNKILSASEIAAEMDFSRNHVAKVLQTLSKARLISSTRGPKGGFVLAKPPESISIWDIMQLIDGNIEVMHCRGAENICPFKQCVYGDIRQKLFHEFKTYYSNRTISDIN